MTGNDEFFNAEIKRLDAKLTEVIDFINKDAAHRADITQRIYGRISEMYDLVYAMAEKVFPGYSADMLKIMALGDNAKKPPEKL
jgi:hypothetical protein